MRYGRGYTKPAPGRPIALGHLGARECVLRMPMNEGAGVRVNDMSGHGHHGAIAGAVWTGGLDGWALKFAGSEYITVADHGDFNFVDGFALSAWAKPDATDASGRLIYRIAGDIYGGTGEGYNFYQSSSGDGMWIFMVYVEGAYTGVFSDEPPTGGWQHILGVREPGGTMYLYVDGKVQQEVDVRVGVVDNNSTLWIGQDAAGGTRFSGLIGQIGVLSYAPSAEEAQRLFAEKYGHYRR